MLTPSSICNLSRAIRCAARAPGPMLFVVAGGVAGRRGVVAFAGGRGLFWPEGRGGCCCFCRGVLARRARRVLLPGLLLASP